MEAQHPISTEPEVTGSTTTATTKKTVRRSSSKSQHRLKAALSPPSLLSPPATSTSTSLSTPSTSGATPQRHGARRSPSVASIRQPQATVSVAAPEVAVSMVLAEREQGAPLGSAEAQLAVGLGIVNSSGPTASESGSPPGSGLADGDLNPPPGPQTTPSTSSSAASTSTAVSSKRWFSSLGRSKGRQASSSISILQEQQRRSSRLSPTTTRSNTALSPASTSSSLPTTTNSAVTATPTATVTTSKAGKEKEMDPTHDVDGLPPMLTITDMFPVPMHESPSEEAQPQQESVTPSSGGLRSEGGEGAGGEGKDLVEQVMASVEPAIQAPGGVNGAVAAGHAGTSQPEPTPIRTPSMNSSTAPTTNIAPFSPPTSTPSSPPPPSSLSTTPRMRSWFYSSPSKPKPTPTPTPAPVILPILQNTIEEAVISPPHPSSSSPPAPALTTSPPPAGATMQITQTLTQLSQPSTNNKAPLVNVGSPPQPIPGRSDLSTSPEEEDGPRQTTSGSSSIPSSIDDFVPPLPVTPPVPGQPQHTNTVSLAQTLDRKTGRTTSAASSTPTSSSPGSRFTLSIPLLGRTKIPLGVVLGDKKESTDVTRKDVDGKGVAGGSEMTLNNNIKAESSALVTAPGQTSSSTDTTTTLSPTEPVQSQLTPSSSDTARQSLSQAVSAPDPRLGRTEGVKTEGNAEIKADDSVVECTTTSSTTPNLNRPSSAEQYEGLSSSDAYSWWNYVGWGSATSSATAVNECAADADKGGLVGSSESGQTVARNAACAEEHGSAKDAGVGSSPSQKKTDEDQGRVTLATRTKKSTTTLKSDAVAGAEANANVNRTTSFAAGTSANAMEGQPQAGVTVQRKLGHGKKGDGEVEDVGAPVDVGQATDKGNKLEGAESMGSDTKTLEAGGRSAQAFEDPSSGSSWLSPWAWIGTSTTSTTAGTVDPTPEPATTSEALKEHKEERGRDGVLVAQRVEEVTKEQKLAEEQKPDDSSPQVVADEAPELAVAVTTLDRERELPNPIEESLKANHSGWASFFSKQSLFVKAIGYGGANEAPKMIKRDEHGVEVMDLDSDGESENEDGWKKDDASSDGGGSRSRSLVPKLLTNPVEKFAGTTSRSRSSSQSPRGRSPVPKDGERPAEPLTGDDNLKRKVTSVPMGKRPSKGSSSGSSTPVPPSPSGSVPLPNGKAPQPPVVEKSKSAPVTPKRTASPSPSMAKKNSTSSPPNLVLPTWADIFHTRPRSVVLQPPSPPASPPTTPGSAQDTGVGTRLFGKTMKFVSGVLWAKDGGEHGRDPEVLQAGQSSRDGNQRSNRNGRQHFNAPHPLRRSSSGGALDIASLLEQERKVRFENYGQELPKSWEVLEGALVDGANGKRLTTTRSRAASALSSSGNDVMGHVSAEEVSRGISKDVLRGCRQVVIIGVHGWFPGAVMRTVLGEPTGTSSKFANMMEQAIQEFEDEQGVHLEKITKIPLEGEGTIERRVEKLYSSLIANSEWMDDLREADVIFIATHSQGSVVSTHLMNKLLQERIIYTRPEELVASGGDTFPSAVGLPRSSKRKLQRVCCLALCGIHLGPLRYLNTSSLVAPYIQYFENGAARELFEFQNTESTVSKAYVKALANVLDHGIKMVYVASLNDQVVPIYSGVFTAVTHPLILRALYIDGDAYHSSDFLSNLLVLLLRLRNSGIPDGGLLTHLSEATAGSLSGVGHSTAYEELATYSLAVRYLFMTNNGSEKHPSLVIEPFDAATEQNDYEIPWSLRDLIADERVIHFFSNEVGKLRDAFREWHPKTTILRDLKRKLQPIQRLPPSFSSGSYSTSKL